MRLNLKIEGRTVDLSTDSGITLQKNSNVCSGVDKIKTSRSFSIVCPFTSNNHIIFQFLELPSNSGNFLTTAKTATLEDDGLFVFNGKAVLLSIGEDGYEIALMFGELTALAALVADNRKISELGFTEVFADWTRTAPFTGSKQNTGLYRYNTGMDAYVPLFRQRSYSIQLSYLVGLIATYYGISFSFPFDITDDYLILTNNLNTNAAINPIITIKRGLFGATSQQYSEDRVGGIVYGTQASKNCFSPNLACSDLTTFVAIFNNEKISKLKITCLEKLNPPEPLDLVHYNSLTELEDIYPLNNAGDFIEITVSAGDTIRTEYGINTGSFLIKVEVVFMEGSGFPLSDRLNYLFEGYYSDVYFPIFANCDFTALDLIKQAQIFYGLFPMQGNTSSAFIFKNFSHLDDRTTVQDLSDNFISLKKSEFKFNEWAKVNKFMFTRYDAEITDDYNSAQFELDYYSLPENYEVKSIFGTGTLETPLRINQYKLVIAEDTGDVEDADLPCIFAKLNSSMQLVAIPFSEILANRYPVLIDKLENMRVCTVDLNLSQIEYANFNVDMPIYIKQLGKYFYLISGNYDMDSGVFEMEALLV